MSLDLDKMIVGPRPSTASKRMAEAIRRATSRLVDAGQAAQVAALSTEELLAQLKAADSEIASFDALRDQDTLLAILRRETEPSQADLDRDCLARLRILGLVDHEGDIGPPSLTAAGRRLAISLL